MLTIYGVPVSVHTRKVIVAANHKDLDYENVPIIPFDPPENWRNLSPTGLIPAITHDGFENFDSVAICAYLERLKPIPSLYPSDTRQYSRALALEQYATSVLFLSVVHPLFHQKVIKPDILQKGPADMAEIVRIETEVAPGIFNFLDTQMSGQRFCIGGKFSIADIAIGANLINYHYLGFRIDAGKYPNLARVFETILTEPAVAKALDAEQPFATEMGLERSFLE